MVLARGSTLMDLPGVGPVVAARILADACDVTRFADRNRFALPGQPMDLPRPPGNTAATADATVTAPAPASAASDGHGSPT
uniref:Transposase IS116/IS110/IS902 C-terminal domain-containing protein n=1 Tax=uncultured Nocardioidaceae bacterium TaxID=253824 RepID=A0A6J4LV33_9ACTN|nr:MAG: hypothetical protein AVDCRST_MAG46-2095 [uncultured Nocardioidaceae bacterium]